MLTNQLNDIIDGLGAMGFELALGIGALLLLIMGLINKEILVSKGIYLLVLLVALWLMPAVEEPVLLFGDVLALDRLGFVLKLLFGIVGLWIVFFPTSKSHPPEFYFLIIAIILGSSLMLMANQLLLIYLVVELTSFGAYIITNFNFKKQSFEAGMKYLIFGGVSSALALYGASLIYGFTGTLSLESMNFELMDHPALLNVGILLFAGALLFKVSVVPFHIWVPSAYQEAPTDAVLILSVMPKIGGFVLLHRVLSVVQIQDNYWLYVVFVSLGIATVVMGTLGALRQTNIKRLIAYGAVAHSGFLLATLLIPFEQGATAFLWYAAIYALMNLAVFYLVSVFESMGKTDILQLSGLYSSESYLGGLTVIVMIALIGLPPTAGFTAKFYLFTVIWSWYQELGDTAVLLYLVILILSVVISLFFYLKIPYYIFMKDGADSLNKKSSLIDKLLATIFSIALLWIFLSPEILNKIAENINSIHW